MAAQDVAFAVHEARFVTTFPQRARATVACVELPGIATAELLHQARNGACFRRHDQQVHVVVHQHVGMQYTASVQKRFAKEVQIAAAVSVIQEARQAIVAALDDMLGNACEVVAGLSCHPFSMAAGGVASAAALAAFGRRHAPLRLPEVNRTPFTAVHPSDFFQSRCVRQ